MGVRTVRVLVPPKGRSSSTVLVTMLRENISSGLLNCPIPQEEPKIVYYMFLCENSWLEYLQEIYF